jgi:hypothetical protein
VSIIRELECGVKTGESSYPVPMNKRPEEQLAEMIASLKEKTGKTLDEWFELIQEAGHQKHGQMMSFLKGQHGVSHGYANQIALRSVERLQGKSTDDEVDPVDEMFAGSKASLRPIYDAVKVVLDTLGSDVDYAPKKGYVSVRRKKQFAILQPSTATRFDLGINLKGVEPIGRLEASGSFNAMVTHRVPLSSVEDVDTEVAAWLKEAYDSA